MFDPCTDDDPATGPSTSPAEQNKAGSKCAPLAPIKPDPVAEEIPAVPAAITTESRLLGLRFSDFTGFDSAADNQCDIPRSGW